MDLLLRPKELIEVMIKHDPSGIITRLIHVGDKGDLYDCEPLINITDDSNDIYLYPVRFGYDVNGLSYDIRHNMLARTMCMLVSENTVELIIDFTPNHYDDFIKRLEKDIKKIAKRCRAYEGGGDPPDDLDELYGTLKELRFHSKNLRNYFWNNSLTFWFNKEDIIQQ